MLLIYIRKPDSGWSEDSEEVNKILMDTHFPASGAVDLEIREGERIVPDKRLNSYHS